jgi:hypothetical protein
MEMGGSIQNGDGGHNINPIITHDLSTSPFNLMVERIMDAPPEVLQNMIFVIKKISKRTKI